MRWKTLTAGTCIAVLCGCPTPEEQAAEHARYIEEIRQGCLSYGFAPNTPELASCVEATIQTENLMRQREFERMRWESQQAFETFKRQSEESEYRRQMESQHDHP